MPSFRPVLAILLLALLPGTASAADVWVESTPLDSRSAARDLRDGLDLLDLAARLADEDLAGEVQRRFVPGDGWGYVLRIEGLDDLGAARLAAAWLADAGVRATLWTREGSEVVQVGSVAAQVPAASAQGASTPIDMPSHRILRAAGKAHGGTRGGLELLRQAEALAFDFERRVYLADGELLAANRYRRLGEAVRLEVDIVEGAGLDSRTVLTPGNKAWVRAGEEDAVGRDPARTREVLVRFSPEGVLAIPLGLAVDLERAADWEGLQVAGRVQQGEQELWVLEPSSEPTGEGLLAARFGVEDALLHSVRWATPAGELDFGFDDYRELQPGLVVPHRVEISRDGRPVEAVRVLSLALDQPLEAELFEAP